MTNRKRKAIHKNKNTPIISIGVQQLIRLTTDVIARLNVWEELVSEQGDPFNSFSKGNTF